MDLMKRKSNPDLIYTAKFAMGGFAYVHLLKTEEDDDGSIYVVFKHRYKGLVKLGIGQDRENLFIHWAWWHDDFHHGKRSVGGGRRDLKCLNLEKIMHILRTMAIKLENIETENFPILEQDFGWAKTIPEIAHNNYIDSVPCIQNL
jgi:hypothetical protein